MERRIKSWQQKKNIMLNKSKLKERKGERMCTTCLRNKYINFNQ
jgi:hypothetical protein